MRSINFLLLAAFAGTALNAAPADDENAISMVVDLRGMQLTKEADVRRLNRRVYQLATAVCYPPGTRGVGDHGAFNDCKAAALRDAQRQVQVALAAAQSRNSIQLAAAK